MRILLVSQMYPGPGDPDLGIFVKGMEEALARRGHEIERAVLDSRDGGKGRYATLAARVREAARRFRPDVAYAHFLVPGGLAALLARAPLVVTAHGQDVRNVGAVPGVAAVTRYTVGRAAAVIAVSGFLRHELEAKVPAARGKTEVIDMGVDLERFRVTEAPRSDPGTGPEGTRPGSDPGRVPTGYLCIGGLSKRKNVLRLADAFERLDEGTLTFAGDGPLRAALDGRPRIRLLGVVGHGDIPALIAEHRVVVQPSLVEPFGQALLEGLAAGRPVVATRIGGPPEFVPPEAGVLVDPTDRSALAAALEAAAALPCPNPAARAAAEAHDVNRQAERVEAVLERAARGRRA